jgi:hypothetical protein
MLNSKLLLVVMMAVALWVYFNETRRTDDQDPGTTATEPDQSSAVEGRILEDRTFETYAECNDAAKAAVEDLKEKGVSAALASQSPLVESTVYMVYYRGAKGQISCRGGRLVNEIIKE